MKPKYQVETGIAIPAIKRRAKKSGRPTVYPWPGMPVGGSFFVEGGTINKVTSVASAYALRHGTKYTCRTVKGGVRVFRIA
jgi:hypothetical protein